MINNLNLDKNLQKKSSQYATW